MTNKYNLTLLESRLLKEWTKKDFRDLLFDSNTMNCTKESSQLFDIIKFRKNLLFIIEDEKGKKFGGYVNAEITKSHEWIDDENAFVFTLVNNAYIEPEMFPC